MLPVLQHDLRAQGLRNRPAPVRDAVARVLTVMQLLPALESGGVERSTIEIAQALTGAGQRALVVSAGGRLVPDLEQVGAEHIMLAIGRKSPRVLCEVARLRRLIEAQRPDIVHARSRLPGWIAWLALRGLGERRPAFVTTVHGLNSVSRYSAILTRGERVICVSETVRRHVLANYPRVDPARLRVIERGIDVSAFHRQHHVAADWRAAFAAEHPQLTRRPWLVLPGRGTRLKGHEYGIELVARLRAAGCDVGLLLQGVVEPGRERYLAELRALALRRGVAEQVVFAAPRRDIREVLAESFAVLQLSAKPEAFGRTVAEALALGRPVLGWDHGGVGEQLRRGFPQGAVALGDMDALVARASQWLAESPRVPEIRPFTLEAMQEATLALYREVVDGG